MHLSSHLQVRDLCIQTIVINVNHNCIVQHQKQLWVDDKVAVCSFGNQTWNMYVLPGGLPSVLALLVFFVVHRGVFAENACEREELCTCRGKWTQLLQTLTNGSLEEFRHAVWPFANATTNTYTWNLDDPVEGWNLILTRKPDSGMHALAYQV